MVSETDLEHLSQLFEGKAEEMEWQSMMERTTPNMAYQAWRHEPKVNISTEMTQFNSIRLLASTTVDLLYFLNAYLGYVAAKI